MTLPVLCNNTTSRACKSSGFVFGELLIAVAILAALFAASVPLYTRLYTQAQLHEHTSELAQTVRSARARAVARSNDSSHGIYLESQSYTLYQGSSYSTRTTAHDRTITLDSALTLTNTISGNDINFSQSLGEPSATGTITLTHDVHGTTTLSIQDAGTIQR